MYGYLPVPIKKYHVQMVRQFLIDYNVNQIKELEEVKYGTGIIRKIIENNNLVLEFINSTDNQNIKFHLDENRRIKQVYMIL